MDGATTTMIIGALMGAITLMASAVVVQFWIILGQKDMVSSLRSRVVFFEQESIRYQAILEGRGVSETKAIIVVDGDSGLITEWNQAATMLFHWTMREMLGKPLTWIMPPRYAMKHSEFWSKWKSEKRAPRGGPVDLEGLTKDGSEVLIRLWLASWSDGQSKIMLAATIERRAEEPSEPKTLNVRNPKDSNHPNP